uniref:Uncharacterized protein n=1 Tax=Timema douglasi TaxID=61478 RepID=A0A7R8VU56_TIMDO|nr:unnamed protein product [Timema douglasi]
MNCVCGLCVGGDLGVDVWIPDGFNNSKNIGTARSTGEYVSKTTRKSEGLGYLSNTWYVTQDSLGVEAVRPTTQTSRLPVSFSGARAEVPPSRI